ncbi:Cas4-domain exonuclease [Idiomarinaceae phage 1N2-2]|uniref:Cas4-domain exonuclease n=1 Tax=Idiomarinaceae phage 1N2-2 TaxID=1536592 RepID=UPI0004F84E3A|nr:Cas4-domain exonuclease [Idiomarinaceae phage 1N2-2]AIM40749.1 putative Cas4-domain exonuclease [Idiomarinaceae phage 1N2-2]
MKLPNREHSVSAYIDKHHEAEPDPFRPHFGASQAGHHCERFLWLAFRWAFKEKFTGRMLRLFRRGQLEESVFVHDLKAIGIDIQDTDENGKQFRVDFGSHVSGSMDGMAKSGVPGAENTPHIVEMKTHNDKSFKQLKEKGVKESKPMHWAQMQLYMLGTGTERALYVAVNKNDDELYDERVKLDKEAAERLLERAKRIATSDRSPDRCAGASPEWYQCKFCPAYNMCHQGAITMQRNCRTCAHSTAQSDGQWHCARWGDIIPTVNQYAGCDSHVMHPDMVPWDLLGGDVVSAEYQRKGQRFVNGEGGVSSLDIMRAELE